MTPMCLFIIYYHFILPCGAGQPSSGAPQCTEPALRCAPDPPIIRSPGPPIHHPVPTPPHRPPPAPACLLLSTWRCRKTAGYLRSGWQRSRFLPGSTRSAEAQKRRSAKAQKRRSAEAQNREAPKPEAQKREAQKRRSARRSAEGDPCLSGLALFQSCAGGGLSVVRGLGPSLPRCGSPHLYSETPDAGKCVLVVKVSVRSVTGISNMAIHLEGCQKYCARLRAAAALERGVPLPPWAVPGPRRWRWRRARRA